MNGKEKRDFILKEVQKRIVGPGYTEETYACDSDASDEVLINRPQIVYTSGILFPQANDQFQEDQYDPQEEINQNGEVSNENPSENRASEDNIESSNFTEEEATNKKEESFDNSDDTNKFYPTHIGLIACLDTTCKSIKIDIEYGKYYVLNDSDIPKEVHVRLGRCTLSQLRETFEYYDSYAKDILKKIGVTKMSDLFIIDEENKTVSPKRIFWIKEEGKKPRIPYPNDFPALLRNKVASVIYTLLEKEKETLKFNSFNLTKEDFIKIVSEISKEEKIKEQLRLINIDSLENLFSITPDQIRLNKQIDTSTLELGSLIFIDDPVKDNLLGKLFQFRFFKRKQFNIHDIEINIENEDFEIKVNEDVNLVWKQIPSRYNKSKKYIHLILVNKNKYSKRTLSQAYLLQAKLVIKSPFIKPYSEPMRSAIEDSEYEINEILYSDEVVYAKGVNCAATWEDSEKPNWVKTTYTPEKIVRSYSPTSDDPKVNEACKIYDLTIWSKLSKEFIIKRFREMTESYKKWHQEQREKAKGDEEILNLILHQQEEFYNRLVKNIDFLDRNEDVYKCFQLANTAMYIQMILGQDEQFKKKGRSYESYIENNDVFSKNSWDYLYRERNLFYRPFQLAFLLMNIESTFREDSKEREDIVDLIWFPTGGGKTEAYLALSAFTIACRRFKYPNDNGVSVIMRYTLRLLTAQQFERASYLICALEYLREQLKQREIGYSLGNNPITMGMWIGKASTPNKITDLDGENKYIQFFKTLRGDRNTKTPSAIPAKNPFPVSCCPWCGCNLTGKNPSNGRILNGYDRDKNDFNLRCINPVCFYHKKLPLYFIDEQLYDNPPTLLFATVDKFAGLIQRKRGKLFGIDTNNTKPDLIIQDELHLISGPLGSIVGMFESMVEELSTLRDQNGEKKRVPKIIASTATTRNTDHLVKQLYIRKVFTFPVSGVRYDDNFFSHVVPLEDCKRLYSGMIPTGHTVSELEIRVIASLLVAKEKLIRETLLANSIDLLDSDKIIDFLFENKYLKEELDNYWSEVIYYKDLKSLGRTHSRIPQEIKANTEAMRSFIKVYPSLDFILKDFYLRATEFTSRQDSSVIRQLLNEAAEPTKILMGKKPRILSKMDLIQATNMISVGIDISRWNLMVMVGQPMTTAEYIQSSSRAGRKYYGLIINILSPNRTREMSLFENYEAYHQVFYKYVEPLSVTTFTEMTLKKLIVILYLCYMVLIKKKETSASISDSDKDEFKEFIRKRSKAAGNNFHYFDKFIDKTIDEVNKIFKDPTFIDVKFSDITNITNPRNSFLREISEKYPVMNSLRDVESNTYVIYE